MKYHLGFGKSYFKIAYFGKEKLYHLWYDYQFLPSLSEEQFNNLSKDLSPIQIYSSDKLIGFPMDTTLANSIIFLNGADGIWDLEKYTR